MSAPMSAKERLHAAVAGKPRDRVPVTPIFMAWAAHHVGHTYRDYYLNAAVRVKAHLAMARDLRVDQASVISDPWCEASAYGMTFDWPADGVGIPHARLLREPGDVATLRSFNPLDHARTSDRIAAVRALAHAIGQTHSVLGWVEGPLAEYEDLRGMEDTMFDLVDRPELFHQAAAVLVDNASRFAKAQVESGADVVGIGDAAASLIGEHLYVDHVLPWQRKLVDAVHDAGALVKLHICGNITAIIPHLPRSGADLIDVDWMVPLDDARAKVGPTVTLCGNFDPASVLLQGAPQQVADAARHCIGAGGDRFVLQPGCEVPPGTPLANLRAFCPVADCPIADALTWVLPVRPAVVETSGTEQPS